MNFNGVLTICHSVRFSSRNYLVAKKNLGRILGLEKTARINSVFYYMVHAEIEYLKNALKKIIAGLCLPDKCRKFVLAYPEYFFCE